MIARDKQVGKDYLLCDYNRDGDSYRSPWSNQYEPPLDDGAMPSERLRRLEIDANTAMLEPVVTKKIAHERLTALVFREECIVTACQDGYVCTWARPGRGAATVGDCE